MLDSDLLRNVNILNCYDELIVLADPGFPSLWERKPEKGFPKKHEKKRKDGPIGVGGMYALCLPLNLLTVLKNFELKNAVFSQYNREYKIHNWGTGTTKRLLTFKGR